MRGTSCRQPLRCLTHFSSSSSAGLHHLITPQPTSQPPIDLRREAEGLSPDPTDQWASREFHVKWKRWSYIHCSWDTLNTLSQLGGFKRVLNYIKRQDELAIMRPRLSREENELRDVERQMEEQLVLTHMLVSGSASSSAGCTAEACLHVITFLETDINKHLRAASPSMAHERPAWRLQIGSPGQ